MKNTKLKNMLLPFILSVVSLGSLFAVWIEYYKDNKKELENERLTNENRELLQRIIAIQEESSNKIALADSEVREVSKELILAKQSLIDIQKQNKDALRGTGFPLVRYAQEGSGSTFYVINDQLLPINHLQVLFWEMPYPKFSEWHFFKSTQTISNMRQNHKERIYYGPSNIFGGSGPDEDGKYRGHIIFGLDWGSDWIVCTAHFVSNRPETESGSFEKLTFRYKDQVYKQDEYEKIIRPKLLSAIKP